MSLFRGTSGKISITESSGTEKYLAHTTNWSVDSSMDVDETPYFGGSAVEEGFMEKTPMVINWTASFEGAVDLSTGSTQADVYAAHVGMKLVTVSLYLDADHCFKGEGYIDSYSATDAADGKAEFTANIAGNGALELVTA